MKCLYCGKRILAFRLFSGGETFCSEEHGNLYRKNEAESAIQRILTLDPPKKPRLTPAPVVAAIPTISEPEPPSMAGFRLPVLEARNHAGDTRVSPLPISLEILTPAWASLTPAEETGAYYDLAWPSGVATVGPETALIPAPRHQRLPLTPMPAFALGGTSPLQRLVWMPRPESQLRLGGTLTLQTSERGYQAVIPAPPALALTSGAARLGWVALADGQANADTAGSSLEAVPAIAMPYLPAEPFTSTWAAHPMLALWTRGCADAASGRPTFAEIALSNLLRLPVAGAHRDARPNATGLVALWRLASESRLQAAEIVIVPRHVLPTLGEFAGTPRSLRDARFNALSFAACRPFPAMPRLAPEPAMEPSIWNAWPEVALTSLAPASSPGTIANGHTWRPLSGLAAGRTGTALRLLDAPERCRNVALTLPAETSALRQAVLTRTPHWPLDAAPPTPHIHPLAMAISPRETVRPPAHAAPAVCRPLAAAPAWRVAPAAQAPPLEKMLRPELGREELALRFVSHRPEVGTSLPRTLATVSLRPSLSLTALAPNAEPDVIPARFERPESILRQPVNGCTAPLFRNAAAATQCWGQTSDGRPLDAALAQPREAPLRLCVEEIPCSLTLDIAQPMAQPAASTWTPLALLPAAAPREFAGATLTPVRQALRAPGILITARVTSMAQAQFTPCAWASLRAAPEPVVRRRQLPASRPKMNLPRLRPLKGSIALPGLTQLAAILATERQAGGSGESCSLDLELVPRKG